MRFNQWICLPILQITFDGLLPHETVDASKLTCINIAAQQALAKINEWRSKNLKGIGNLIKIYLAIPLNLISAFSTFCSTEQIEHIQRTIYWFLNGVFS